MRIITHRRKICGKSSQYFEGVRVQLVLLLGIGRGCLSLLSMVGIGQVTGGGSRWGSEFIDPVLSVYPGMYDPDADYEKLTPAKTLKLESFGGVKPTPYPGGGTQIVRGFIQLNTTGVFEFRPGYGGSTHNIMEVDGREVYRKEPGNDPVNTNIKLTAGKKVPFKITYLTDQANGLGWIARIDIPGTLATVVKQDGKFPYLVDKHGNWVEGKMSGIRAW